MGGLDTSVGESPELGHLIDCALCPLDEGHRWALRATMLSATPYMLVRRLRPDDPKEWKTYILALRFPRNTKIGYFPCDGVVINGALLRRGVGY